MSDTQDTSPKVTEYHSRCSSPEATQFDFWLGDWRQTWVDNDGGYLDFSGEFKDEKMILSREAVINGQKVKQRIVWYNINQNKLDWNWQRSEDNDKTWQTMRHVNYQQKG